MATIPKTKIGHLECLGCGEKVVIRESATGTLTGTCQECGFQHQAKKHDGCYASMLQKITRTAGPASSAPPAAPSKQPAAAPATMASAPVSKRNTCFG